MAARDDRERALYIISVAAELAVSVAPEVFSGCKRLFHGFTRDLDLEIRAVRLTALGPAAASRSSISCPINSNSSASTTPTAGSASTSARSWAGSKAPSSCPDRRAASKAIP